MKLIKTKLTVRRLLLYLFILFIVSLFTPSIAFTTATVLAIAITLAYIIISSLIRWLNPRP